MGIRNSRELESKTTARNWLYPIAGLLAFLAISAGSAILRSGNLAALPLAWAFSAGMLATVNPCGWAMLPSYGAY